MKSKGLGDSIEKITKATGIKAATDYIFDKLGIDCKCDERKEKLNKIFKYKKIECMTEEEYNFLKQFFKRRTNKLTTEAQQHLLKIHNRVFNDKREMTSCSSCVKELINTMQKLYTEYEEEKR